MSHSGPDSRMVRIQHQPMFRSQTLGMREEKAIVQVRKSRSSDERAISRNKLDQPQVLPIERWFEYDFEADL